MGKLTLTPSVLEMIAERFKTLAEPARLAILNQLRGGEQSVGELVETTGLGQANVSKHLAQLHRMGFVRRRKEGLYVYYALADRRVFKLCDVMCDRITADIRRRHRVLGGGVARRATA